MQRTRLVSQGTALTFQLTVNTFSLIFTLLVPRILQFEVLPIIVPFSFGEEEVNFDDAATAVCTITKGDLPIHIWWTLTDSDLHMDRNLSTSDGVMITRNSQKISMLAIDAVKARHRGNYTCFAQNSAGITQHSAFLFVNGD